MVPRLLPRIYMAGTFTATSNNSGCRVLGFVSVGDGTRDSGGGNVMCDAYVSGCKIESCCVMW